MDLLEVLKFLSEMFEKHNFHIYAVGGTVRDFLLQKNLFDFDFVTDATPNDMKMFLDNYNDVFAQYGVIIYRYKETKLEIATMRVEGDYADSRHPKKVTFVKTLQEDYRRRDFTINALYMDKNGRVFDFCNGIEDLKKKTIKVIGNISARMKEDPLRMLRALRFALTLEFSLDNDLKNYIKENISLIEKLNIQKVLEEVKKMNKINEVETSRILNNFNIKLFNNHS